MVPWHRSLSQTSWNSFVPSAAAMCISFGGAIVLEARCRAPPVGEVQFEWDTDRESAEGIAHTLKTILGGDGLELLVGAAGEIPERPGVAQVYLPDSAWVWYPWDQVAGMVHVVGTSALSPEQSLEVELGHEPRPSPVAEVGIFVLQSFGRELWRAVAAALDATWRRGLLKSVRLHSLVHDHRMWRPWAWREALGMAAPIFRGLHWCGSEAKAGILVVPYNNYLPKVSTIISLLYRFGYSYLVSLDDDVMLPPASLGALLTVGPKADAMGCGVVVPLLQNGVPTVELWAETFLTLPEQNFLYQCFEDSTAVYYGKRFTELEPMPRPWDGFTWYSRVRAMVDVSSQGIHPVRGNNSCMGAALSLALSKIREEWPRWDQNHGLLVDKVGNYPYVLNNAFLMRGDRYSEAVGRPDFQGTGADELPMNMLINERGWFRCFLSESFGLHPAYGSHPRQADMESVALAEVLAVANLSRE